MSISSFLYQCSLGVGLPWTLQMNLAPCPSTTSTTSGACTIIGRSWSSSLSSMSFLKTIKTKSSKKFKKNLNLDVRFKTIYLRGKRSLNLCHFRFCVCLQITLVRKTEYFDRQGSSILTCP